MVPVDSVGVPRDPTYSGTLREVNLLSLTGLSPSMARCSNECGSASSLLCNSHVKGPTTPLPKMGSVWAISLSLAATNEIDFSLFSFGYLDVSVHRVCLHAPMDSAQEQFRNPRIKVRLSTPPGFSQTSTPFIAFLCQDIPRAPLYT